MAAPEEFASQALPPMLPREVSESRASSISAAKVAYGGYCPVALAKDGKSGIRRGSKGFVAEYDGRFYFMSSQKVWI